MLEQETGLLLFDNGSFKTIPGSEIFLTSSIYTMLPYDDFGNKILIATKSAKLFLYDGNSFSHFNTDAEEFLLKNNIYPHYIVGDFDSINRDDIKKLEIDSIKK